jgi:hypothetical protein
MPVFTACLTDGTEVAAVIAPDDDFGREMLKKKLLEDQRNITFHYWEQSGFRIKLHEKGYKGDLPRSLF